MKEGVSLPPLPYRMKQIIKEGKEYVCYFS